MAKEWRGSTVPYSLWQHFSPPPPPLSFLKTAAAGKEHFCQSTIPMLKDNILLTLLFWFSSLLGSHISVLIKCPDHSRQVQWCFYLLPQSFTMSVHLINVGILDIYGLNNSHSDFELFTRLLSYIKMVDVHLHIRIFFIILTGWIIIFLGNWEQTALVKFDTVYSIVYFMVWLLEF